MASFLSTLKENILGLPQMAKDISRNILGSPIGRTLGAPKQTPTRVSTPVSTGVTTGRVAPAPTRTAPSGGGYVGGGGGGGSLSEQANNSLVDSISQSIIDLENKLNEIPSMILSDAEKEAFLQKAIAQVTPYYDKKKAEIEKGIETGKIRSAEDVLLTIREVRQEADDLLKRYDIEEAQTEEDFVNTLADITNTESETLETSRYNWRERVKAVKQGQVESGVLTSGIGRKEIGELLGRQTTEQETIGRQAGQARTELETGKKYDLQRISLARETVGRERVRRIGGTEAEAGTTTAALGTAGIPSLAELPSEQEIERRRGLEPTTIYRPESLTELAEERTRAQESRKLSLQAEELAVRDARRREQERLIRYS